MKPLHRFVLILLAASLAACASAPEAWERGRLARPEMAWEPDALTAGYRDNLHFSKEAASGGASIGGGGCGCN